MNKLIWYDVFRVLEETWVSGNACGVPKCWKENPLWISVAASMKEEGGQHVHGWENITIAEVKATAVLKNKLVSV